MGWYLEVLKKYAVFSGRARRKEYWMFVLINIIIALILGFIDRGLGGATKDGYGILSGIYSLAVLVPTIAVTVRRLHDTGRQGLWYLIVLIPFIGSLALIWFCVQDSEPGSNQFGPNPKGVA